MLYNRRPIIFPSIVAKAPRASEGVAQATTITIIIGTVFKESENGVSLFLPDNVVNSMIPLKGARRF